MGPVLTTIVLATDGSPTADEAGRAAIALAGLTGAALHVVCAWSVPHEHETTVSAIDLAYLRGRFEARGRAALVGAIERLAGTGGTITGYQLASGRPAAVILAEAARVGADLIVTGSRGGGPAKRVVLGSVAEEVVRGATCPVLVVRGEDCWPPARIIVGSDGSAASRRAATLAAQLGHASGAEIILLRAVPPLPPAVESTDADAGRTAQLQAQALRRAGRELNAEAGALGAPVGCRLEPCTKAQEAAIALLRAAEDGPGPALIVVGTRGTAPAGQLWIGSTALRILTCAEGSVLVCPHHAAPEG